MAGLEISLTERGEPLALPASYAGYSSLNHLLGRLCPAKIVRAQTTLDSGQLLFPSVFVGSATAPGCRISILPKAPDFYTQMRRVAESRHFRYTFDLEARLADERQPVDPTPAHDFYQRLRQSLHEGLPWQYVQTSRQTSLPRGKLLITETVRELACRGINHRVVTSRTSRRQRTYVAQVIHAASECLPTSIDCTPALLARTRILLEAVEKHPTTLQPIEAIRTAESAIRESEQLYSPTTIGLLRSCIALLRREETPSSLVEYLPNVRIKFHNLERLWEQCVLLLCEHSFPESAGFNTRPHPFDPGEQTLLVGGGPWLDPDVVAFRGDRADRIVDAKYKFIEGPNDAVSSDVYQMYAYVTKSRATSGTIVYCTNEDCFMNTIGTTADGTPIYVAGINASLLREHGKESLSQLLAAGDLATQARG